MLYIHKLADLNSKAAAIESIQIIRDLKRTMKLPVTEDSLKELMADYRVSPTDIATITATPDKIELAINKLLEIFKRKDPIHEPVVFERTVKTLASYPPVLMNNLEYSQQIASLEKQLLSDWTFILNRLPKLNPSEYGSINAMLDKIFRTILRNDGFEMNYQGLVHEGQVKTSQDICDAVTDGIFFHKKLEEEIAKYNFSKIRLRIHPLNLQEIEQLGETFKEIKKGVDRAYEMNMRMVELAVLIHSSLRWAAESK